MGERVCPWWLGYFLISPIRRWGAGQPEKLLAPSVREGMTVLEPGPGMGFFTLPLARLVGSTGRVIAVDVQARMLNSLRRRALKAGLARRIETRLAPPESMCIGDLAGKADFVLAFAVVHETPSAEVFFQEAGAALKEDGRLLFAEPEGHVSTAQFAQEMYAARQAGFERLERIEVRRSQAALLVKR
jgi:tRNA A58 N-methylase Trm61